MPTAAPSSSLTTYATRQPGGPVATAATPSTGAVSLRCLVVAADPATQLELHQCLAHLPSLLAVGSSATAPDTLALLQAHPVEVLLLPVLMPLPEGLDLIRLLLQHLPRLPLLLFARDTMAHTAPPPPAQLSFACFLKTAFLATTQRQAMRKLTIQSPMSADSVAVWQAADQVPAPLHFAELCHPDPTNAAYVSLVTRRLVAFSA